MQESPVVIEAAINGVTDKRRNPHVPVTPEEIAADALACLEAGAAVVHNHVDKQAADGATIAARQLEGWRPIAAARSDAILYPTVGFGGGAEARFGHVPILAASGLMQMGVFDPGSVNLGGVDENGVPGGPIDFIYANSFADIRVAANLCEEHRLGPSIAIFEPGFLRTTLAYHRAGRLPAGAFVKFYFGGDADYLGGRPRGVSFGLPPTAKALDAYLEMMEGCDLPWAVAVVGGDVVASGMAERALERGGHLRVGLEDFAGSRHPRNAELVSEAVEVARRVGRPIASCREAARILRLPRAS
jgi:3-keto-5-aminohexanoate cleavage enzyme